MDFPELISLFATHRVADIDTLPDYVALCARHAGNVQFQRQRDATEVAKRSLEELLGGQPTYAIQVRQALLKLQDIKVNQQEQGGIDYFDLYYQLMVAGYKPGWKAEQQAYFERIVPTIRTGNDYFLSFTSRGPTPAVGFKRINQLYWYFISAVLGREAITKTDRKTRNLLAEAVRAKLTDASLRGFYYISHENDNAVVTNKLRAGLMGSRVFIQLVENVMFEQPMSGKTNYCEYEYRGAVEFMPEEYRILFVVTGNSPDDLAEPTGVYQPYRDWVERIRTKAVPYLPPAEEYDRERLDQIKGKVADVIALVKSARKNVLDQIPA